MKTLFETFKKSIYNPEFYRTAADVPLGDTIRYYMKVVFGLALVATTIFAFILVPQGVRFMRDTAPSLVREQYPVELTIRIEKGIVSTNVTEPYIIAGKNSTREVLKESGVENLLVIDTTEDFNTKTFDEYKTLALFTKSQIVTRNNSGRATIQDLRGVTDATIDQAMLLRWVEKIRSALVYVVPVGIFVTIIILFLGYVVYLVPLFLFALIPFFLSKIRKIPLTYRGAYKMSIYAVVPGLALKTLLNIIGFFFVPVYLSLLVFMLIIFINMREAEQPTLFSND
ncbi:MAG: hypothetical protein A2481_00985 [Candidatus Yonathbacteria bacterium RIFOXYC2_FULL_47_9]|nr:MAG: hypothetical protein A2481_00985 [Candidatus Yonathbacteria bacterium RIFOXYC2_FULL_47_9]HAT68760.1 hypothetical protein [Candidatus Yonathbacteria bacterium]